MAAPTALALQAASSNAQLTRTLERLFEEAQHTGDLKLNGRKLKELPSYAAKYDLRDIVQAAIPRLCTYARSASGARRRQQHRTPCRPY
ncbi:hypothetical protein MTO96_008629 [Rhipicephalus appendiculatus]